MSDIQAFCVECGTALHGAKFCPHCGAMTENAVDPEESAFAGEDQGTAATAVLAPPAQRTAPRLVPPPPQIRTPAPPAAESPRHPIRIALIVGAFVLVLALVIGVVLLSSRSGGPSYANQAAVVLGPTIQANRQLTSALSTLPAQSSSAGAQTAVQDTGLALQAAQQKLNALKPGSGDQELASAAKTTLISELAFLNAASTALGNPSSPVADQLGMLSNATKSQLLALDQKVPGASASFPGNSAISTWVQQQRLKVSLRTFAGQVDRLLSQSGPSFDEINQAFGLMENPDPSTSVAQVEAMIGGMIANRTTLQATASTLSSPTAQAGRVRDAFATSFADSLTNDRAIQDCLNQANYGSVAIIFQSCLDSTASSSNAATQAKDYFRSLYNQLRQSMGLGEVNPQY